MTTEAKFVTAGCTAGVAAASLPIIYGTVKNLIPKPLDENDFLHTENGLFTAANGNIICLRGFNMNDELFFFKKDGLDENASNYDIFAVLEERFGRYGARKLIGTYNENFIAGSDIKNVKKLGANCIRLPIRYKNICRKENCKGDVDFDWMDAVVEKCRKAGVYVIIDLHSAPGFQNNDSAGGKDDNCILFDSSKDAFDARNAVVRIWSQIAAHFKDEPAIAAYDLLNRPLNKVADWQDKLETLNKLYLRTAKAIRGVGDNHVVILQSAFSADYLPEFKTTPENIAFGLYLHSHTSFETDALIASVRSKKPLKIPFVISKIRADENIEYTLTALCDNGISWFIGDYKGSGARSAYLYAGEAECVDFDTDDYDKMSEKWSKPLATKNFEKNEELAKTLKDAFRYGTVRIEKEPEKKSPVFKKFGVGKYTVIGKNKIKDAE